MLDGSGYPYGLSCEDIDISGLIVALADVYDALGSKRCYKEPWPEEKILSLIQEESSKHFDPALVQVLIDNIHQISILREQYPDEN